MKFLSAAVTVTLGVNVHNRHRRAGTREIGPEAHDRRYAQLTEMFTSYNPEFDERKFWTYGCNCLMLGDRPMSDPGLGPAVDALDGVCKQYKDCNKCVKQQYGNDCIGEFQAYNFIYGNSGIMCTDPSNTCKRALCECDAKFAADHASKASVFDPQYHTFESDWKPENSCPSGSGGSNDPQCCTNSDKSSPFILYNADHKECCTDGQVRPLGQC